MTLKYHDSAPLNARWPLIWQISSYASFAIVSVMVLFYPVATDDTYSSSVRTSAIHKENFIVLLSGGEHNDLFNFVNHIKTFTGLGEKPKVTIAISCSFIILRYTKLFLFCRNLLINVPFEFKMSI